MCKKVEILGHFSSKTSLVPLPHPSGQGSPGGGALRAMPITSIGQFYGQEDWWQGGSLPPTTSPDPVSVYGRPGLESLPSLGPGGSALPPHSILGSARGVASSGKPREEIYRTRLSSSVCRPPLSAAVPELDPGRSAIHPVGRTAGVSCSALGPVPERAEQGKPIVGPTNNSLGSVGISARASQGK